MNIDTIIPKPCANYRLFKTDNTFTLRINSYLYYNIDLLTYNILKEIDKKRSILEIKDNLKLIFPNITTKVVYYTLYLNPDIQNLFKKDIGKQQIKPSYLTIQIRVIPFVVIDKITSQLKFLFKPTIFIANIFIFITILLYFDGIKHEFKNTLTQVNLLILLFSGLLSIFISIWHELGHATACKRVGVNHGDIGFGFYLLTPVFFTDVTEVWTKNKRERIIVNLGGIYFEFILLNLLLILLFFVQGFLFQLIVLAVLNISILFLYQINPFIRSDGYWVLVDFLDQPNLKKKSLFVLKEFLGMKKNKFSKKDVLMILYTLLSFIFIGAIIIYNISSGILEGPVLFVNWFIDSYHSYPYIDVFNLFNIMPSVLFYILILFFIYKLAKNRYFKRDSQK